MSDNDQKPACKYGIKCYRRNQEHLDRFDHPTKNKPAVNASDAIKQRSSSPSPSSKRQKTVSPSESDSDDESDATKRQSSSPLPSAKRQKTVSVSESDSDCESNSAQNQRSADETTGIGSSVRSALGSAIRWLSPKANDESKNASSSNGGSSNRNTHEDQKLPETESTSSSSSSSNGSSSNGHTSKKDIASPAKPTDGITSSSESASERCSEYINENFDKGPHAQRAEYQKLLDTPADFIRSNFLVEMPDDFLAFWSFCEAESKDNVKPEHLFSQFGLSLVGPFDVLAKKFHNIEPFEPGDYLRHWRFFYDPPEFQTVLVKNDTGIHYGYWRDEPNGECLIARNDSNKSCEFTFIADNLFGAVLYFLEKDITKNLFTNKAALALKKSIEKFAHDKNISLKSFSAKLKSRNLKTVCKTFHKAGLAVPYDRKTDVGYRQLGESDANLKKILNKIADAKGDDALITAAMDKLQPLITAANIACDESDFGSAIELGTDLFCFGAPELHSDALQLLATGYKLVNKPQFIAIAKAHFEKRSKSYKGLSILESVKESSEPKST